MALVDRGLSTYYIKSIRRNGKVTSEYQGSGTGAILMARLDQAERSQREAAAADWRAEKERLEAEDRGLAEAFSQVEGIARAALEAAGFHRHARGAWRKRRASDLASADKAAAEDLARIATGKFSRLAEDRILGQAAGKSVALREAVSRKMETLRDELTGPDPSPVTLLLAERAVVCWATVYCLEADSTGLGGDDDIGQADCHHRRIDRAHRRFLAALKTLAIVQRLGTSETPGLGARS